MNVRAPAQFRAERPDGGIAWFAGRMRVWWRATDLDRQLAEGTHPWTSRELSLRASQLTSRHQRSRFASDLEAIVAKARTGRPDGTPGVPLRRGAIVAGEHELLELVAALRSPAGCRPRAAALVSFLLRDGCSPLYDCEARVTPASLACAAIAGFETHP